MRRVLLTLLALVGVGCALVVTASSTTRQAAVAGMGDPLVRGALVGLLEVVNVAGTWTWLTDKRRHVQAEAAAGVGLASLVTGWCGFLTYGPLGLVAPLGVLATVHLLSRMWTVPATTERAVAGGAAIAQSELDDAHGPIVGEVGPVVGDGDERVMASRADVVAEPAVFDEPKLRRVVPPQWPSEHDTAEGRAGPAADRAA